MDEFKIDGHKISYHIPELSRWINGDRVWPIYLEVSPCGGCNHRCVFCAFDYLGYKPRFLDARVLKSALNQMGKCGLKSVMFAGEGEPLLHKDIVQIVLCAHRSGLDVAMTTNGILLDKQMAKGILPYLSWLRISLDAADPKTYAKLHGCKQEDFYKVLENLRQAAKMKKKNRYACTLGAQLLLLKDNYREIKPLAGILRDMGLDYLIVKPYSRHPKSKNNLCEMASIIARKDSPPLVGGVRGGVQARDNKDFKVIVRSNTIRKLGQARAYQHCLALPFWAYISSQGDVSACSSFLGDKRYVYGNIYKDSFKNICDGEEREKIISYFAQSFDAGKCRENCRMDEVNRYLWELKHPGAHRNFI